MLACLNAPKYAILLEVESSTRRGDMGRDGEAKGEFCIAELGPVLGVGLLPKGDRVLKEDVGLDGAQATLARLVAADCDDDVFGEDGFGVLLDLCADDWGE